VFTTTTTSSTLLGVEGRRVSVEVQLSNGLPSFTMVGLVDTTVREARDRVRAAVISSGLEWPQRRLTVNVAPSDLRKTGSSMDLAIAVGVLAITDQVPADAAQGWAFLGELGLDGRIRSMQGLVPLVHALSGTDLVVPDGGLTLARPVHREGRLEVARSLRDVVEALNDRAMWPEPSPVVSPEDPLPPPDMADVVGQPQARLAGEVAAAGGHHLRPLGPPGAGKTMLARRLAGLLPDLGADDALEATLVHSAAGLPLPGGLLRRPPLRSPHHSASLVGLVGGGSASLRPGEISMAHRGLLFLDEMGEFTPSVLDSLRQPLEEGHIVVTRQRETCQYPARFQLVSAMNPCPCGEAGRPGSCRCSDAARFRYSRRLSGPLLDRFDLRVMVPRPDPDVLIDPPPSESTSVIAERVAAARKRSADRGVRCNADLTADQLADCSQITPEAEDLLHAQLRCGALSARGLSRVKRVALTLADLAGPEPLLDVGWVGLALSLRADAKRLLSGSTG